MSRSRRAPSGYGRAPVAGGLALAATLGIAILALRAEPPDRLADPLVARAVEACRETVLEFPTVAVRTAVEPAPVATGALGFPARAASSGPSDPLPPAGALAFQVVDPADPAEAVSFEARLFHESRFAAVVATRGANVSLTAGCWKGLVHVRGYEPLQVEGEVAPGRTTHLGVLALRRGGASILCRVDSPVAALPVAVELFGPQVGVETTVLRGSPGTTFRFEGLAAARYRVRAMQPGSDERGIVADVALGHDQKSSLGFCLPAVAPLRIALHHHDGSRFTGAYRIGDEGEVERPALTCTLADEAGKEFSVPVAVAAGAALDARAEALLAAGRRRLCSAGCGSRGNRVTRSDRIDVARTSDHQVTKKWPLLGFKESSPAPGVLDGGVLRLPAIQVGTWQCTIRSADFESESFAVVVRDATTAAEARAILALRYAKPVTSR